MDFAKNLKLGIIVIFLLALFLRSYKLSSFPPSLNRDEAALGWNAYSILKTGKDEWGISLPLSFKSFGDYKMPLYIYTLVPSIALFGLNEFAVRFPSAFFGSLTVLLVYFLVKELFSLPIHQSRRLKEKPPRLSLALTASLLLAVSPWHLHYSRIAFEANICLFLVTAGATAFLLSLRRPKYLIVSAIFFVLSLYAYSSVFVFLPPFLAVLLYLFRKESFKKEKWPVLLLAGVILALGSAHALWSVQQVSSAKKAITVFSDPTLIDKFNRLRSGYYSRSPIMARIWLNRFSFFGRIVIVNYLKTFSPKFLFISGGEHPWHAVPGFGNFYIFEAFLLFFGFLAWAKLKGKSKWFILAWLILSPLASAITVDAPHSTRSLPLVIPMLILMSLGIEKFFNFFKKNKLKFWFSLLFIANYLFFLAYFVYSYVCLYPRQYPQSLMLGLKESLLAARNLDKERKIITLDPPAAPYIYALFHLKINPKDFIESVERYGAGVDGLEHVRSFSNFEFLYALPQEKEKAFYLLRPVEGGDESKNVASFYSPDNKPTFAVYDF